MSMKATLDNIANVDAGHIFYKFLAGKLKKGQGPVDLNLLHKQKLHLILLQDLAREALSDAEKDGRDRTEVQEEADLVDGLIEFLDAFQDMLVDDLKVWKYPSDQLLDECQERRKK